MSADPGRRWLLGGVAALAALGGGASWWHAQRKAELPDDAFGLWSMRFAQPQGGELVMAELRGQALLLNFWATWCPPCIKELPEFDRFARDQAGRLRVVGLAIDAPTPVQEFLKRQPVGFAIGLAGLDGTDLARSLGNQGGVLPFTVLLDAKGRIVERRIGETRYAELEAWAKKL